MNKTRPDSSERTGSSHASYKNWVTKDKVAPFQKLVGRIALLLGGKMKAYDYIGLKHTTQSNLREGRISEATARKIYNAYNNITKELLK